MAETKKNDSAAPPVDHEKKIEELEAQLKEAAGELTAARKELKEIKAGADTKALEDEIKELKAQIEELQKAADDDAEAAARQVSSLQRTIDRLRETTGPAESYELRPADANGLTFRYDSVIHGGAGWVFHETLGFGHDSGYGGFIAERAKAAVQRAFDPIRLGAQMPGVGQTYDRLPRFNRQLKLEVIVRILPAEEE